MALKDSDHWPRAAFCSCRRRCCPWWVVGVIVGLLGVVDDVQVGVEVGTLNVVVDVLFEVAVGLLDVVVDVPAEDEVGPLDVVVVEVAGVVILVGGVELLGVIRPP